MQNSKNFQYASLDASLDSIGGEPLAGSDFETEEPDESFSSSEQAVQE